MILGISQARTDPIPSRTGTFPVVCGQWWWGQGCPRCSPAGWSYSCVFLALVLSLSLSYSQHETTSHRESLASLHLSSGSQWPEKERDNVCWTLGRVRATFPTVIPSPWSAIHAGTEVLWGSALSAAISGPCSAASCPSPAQESSHAASLACSDVQCWTWGPSVSSTVAFLHLPFEEAIAGAFWCFSAFLGVGKVDVCIEFPLFVPSGCDSSLW